ncbi:MAG: hypothetical protein HYX22_01750 [Candidatus Yanofskybacteria bacterium]|nr:hypothetical protein [Candidatus Yanofskybacteria bacterium]
MVAIKVMVVPDVVVTENQCPNEEQEPHEPGDDKQWHIPFLSPWLSTVVNELPSREPFWQLEISKIL